MGKLGPEDNVFDVYAVGSPNRDPSAESRPLRRATISMKGWSRENKQICLLAKGDSKKHIFLGLGSR